jgi:hypothetical protein
MAEKSIYPVVLIGKNKTSVVPVAMRDERGAPRKLSGCEQFGCRSLVLSDESVALAWRAGRHGDRPEPMARIGVQQTPSTVLLRLGCKVIGGAD